MHMISVFSVVILFVQKHVEKVFGNVAIFENLENRKNRMMLIYIRAEENL